MPRLFCSALLVVAVTAWITSPARADLCQSVQGGAHTKPSPVTLMEMSLYNDLFPDTATQGNLTWDQVIVQCNRQRDNRGPEVALVTETVTDNAGKKQLRSPDLEEKVIRGHYNFWGIVAFRQKYRYVLSKSGGMWTMIIPYQANINQLNGGSVDLGMGYRFVRSGVLEAPGTNGDGQAWRLYEESQVNTSGGVSTLKPGAKSIVETECSTTTFFPGHEHDYDGQNGVNSYKRDRVNHSIQLGKLQYRYGSDDKHDPVVEGCRVPDYTIVYWAPSATTGTPATGTKSTSTPTTTTTTTSTPLVSASAQEFVLQNFQAVAEHYWTIPGVFQLKLLMLGRNDNDFPESTRKLLRDDDQLTVNFATEFQAHGGREMYKANAWEPHGNFSTMTADTTFEHEVGHAFGLDDEYASDGGLDDCENKGYSTFDATSYKMCTNNAPGPPPRTIYYYLATSRYITKQSECQTDPDCGKDEYCDAGIDTKKNACVALKDDGVACNLVGGGHQCKSGKCDLGHCYTPNSVAMGGACYVDDACKIGKCSSVGGFAGTCVCKTDADCPGQWCNAGTDLTKNKCENRKADGASCDLVGGGHQCTGGACQFSKCYTPKSVSMGGSCFVDDACAKGKCSSVDGFNGTCVCKTDADCPGQWCNAGTDLTKNKCENLKADGASCDLVGGAHQCKGGACKFSKCYTPNSVSMGGSCFVDDACKMGKCSSADGFSGTCVCKVDNDCGAGKWCDAGLDTTRNTCKAKLASGASCGAVGSVGNDHKCKSGQCSGFPDYKCK